MSYEPPKIGAEDARARLPQLLDNAGRGLPTIITRHGKPIAALVPINEARARQKPFPDELIGSGAGYWGDDSARTLREMREEWER